MRKFLSLLLALVMVLCCIPAVAETADGVYEGTGAGLNGQIKVSVTVSGGKITEEGTHDELIASGGEYSKLYEIQSCWYRDDYKGGEQQ